ncbi:MAG: hypothetical protein IT564_11410 [Rhodospirillales bacterium]|nr:hypothetical protein [Rhodospirillales bacterium]
MLSSITSANVHNIAAEAKTKTNDQRWLNAIDRALDELEKSRWMFNGVVLKVMSRTNTQQTYVIEQATKRCSCTAGKNGKPCWHRAAYRLLQIATGVSVEHR